VSRDELLQALRARFPGVALEEAPSMPVLKPVLGEFRPLMEALRHEPGLAFDYPLSQTALDQMEKGLIVSVYHLFSSAHRQSLCVKVDLDRAHPSIPTVSDLWRGCEWFERETFDFFGVAFEGHPDLRRIMLTDDWVGWPLRKDYQDPRMVPRPVF
jgi:NADH:ubiquinone oxidoreductase subunit C